MDWQMLLGDVNIGNIASLIAAIFRGSRNNPQYKVNLYISSLGGDLDSAVRFYDFIKSANINIDTYGFGQVDSAAIMIFLTGRERTLIRNTRVRIHASTYNLTSQDQDISIISEKMKFLRQIDDRYFEVLSKELNLPVKKVKKLYSEGKILSESEVLSYKIATKIADVLPIL